MNNILKKGILGIVFLASSFNLYSKVDPAKANFAQIREKSASIIVAKNPILESDTNAYFSNGPITTHLGLGFGKSDFSYSYDGSTWGQNFNHKEKYSLATRVVVSDFNLNIDSVRTFAYQEFSQKNSTIDKAFLRIWDGPPTLGGRIIWGNLTENLLSNTYWTGIYRGTEFNDTVRPLMAINITTKDLAINKPGTYWFEISVEGTLQSAPWCPPIKQGSDLQFSTVDGWEIMEYCIPLDVYAPQRCNPISLTTNKITGNSIELEYQSLVDLINIEYGPKGFKLGNGIGISGAQSPLTIDSLYKSTTYDIYAQGLCNNNKLSYWKKISELEIPCNGIKKGFIFDLSDSYSDGWNGAEMQVYENGGLVKTLTIFEANSLIDTLYFCLGSRIDVWFYQGLYPEECGLKIQDLRNNDVLYNFNFEGAPTSGPIFSTIIGEGNCISPIKLQADSITANSLLLDWNMTDTISSLQGLIEYGPKGFKEGQGIEIETVTKPIRILGLDENKEYEFVFKQICADSSGYSYSNFLQTKTLCSSNCKYIFNLTDDGEDGWNGNAIKILVNGEFTRELTFTSDKEYQDSSLFCSESIVDFIFSEGRWSKECGFSIMNANSGEIIFQFEPGKRIEDGLLYSFINRCTDCPMPTEIATTDIQPTSFSLSWSNNQLHDSIYHIEYGIAGFRPGHGKTISVKGTEVFISGLSSNTQYDIYINSNCNGQMSLQAGPISVTTQSEKLTKCGFIFKLTDTAGDGWGDNRLHIYQLDELIKYYYIQSGYSLTDTLYLESDINTSFVIRSASEQDECGITIIKMENNDTIYNGGMSKPFFNTFIFSSLLKCAACDELKNFKVDNIGLGTIDISWDETPNDETIEIRYVESGLPIDNGSFLLTTGTQIQLQNLKRGTSYDLYARTIRSYGSKSEWYAIAGVQTGCTNTYQIETQHSYVCSYIPHTSFRISGSELGVDYILYLNGIATNHSLQGTGGALQFENISETGNYTVQAKFAETDCVVPMEGTFEFKRYNNVEFQVQIAQEPLCHNDLTGSITILSDARSLQYSNNGGTTWQSDSVFAQLAAALYVPAVKDSNNCVFTGETVVLQNPEELKFIQVSKTNLTDSLANNGHITITAEGGTGLLEYSIDNGNTWNQSNDFTELAPNTYVVQVKDANNCSTSYGNNPVIVEFRSDINELQKNDVLTVYPNPLKNGTLNITISSAHKKFDIEINTIEGKRIYKGNLLENESLQVSRDVFTPGLYLIRVSNAQLNQTAKLLVE